MTPLVLALLLAGSPSAVEGPVAVLPFKNLGGEAAIDWLRLGMPETLVADLKRSRRIAVVDRSEVEKALAAMASKTDAGNDAAAAAQVGKLVSAKTVVLGSFQRSGDQVRIAARFVAVETGVVTDAAKATGPLASAFTVQDQLVELLIGAAPAERPRRGRPAKAIRAFELYGKSLAAPSDPERVALLKESVAADPEFGYAIDDLAALEARLKGYALASTEKLAAEEKLLLAKAENSKAPSADRLDAAVRLLDGLAAARRFNTLAGIAPRLAALKGLELAEPASFAGFRAQLGLHHHDDALRAGEQYLKAFPTSPRFKTVEGQMREVVSARKKRAARQGEYEADLADKRKDCPGSGALGCDYAPCICTRWNSLVGQPMLDRCSEFLGKHEHDPGADAAEKIAAARFFVAMSLVELGEWSKAEAVIATLEKGPVREWDDEIDVLRAIWPAD